MSYQTYTTEALICGSRAHNTSDKSFLLFTRDAGMLYATARSVREERSKQRCALQDFSLVRISLVRGKAGWRIGSVENEQNTFTLASSRSARSGVLRIVQLLRQFVHGEESHPALYADVRRALAAINDGIADPHQVAEVFALRLLHKLGYIHVTETLQPFVAEDEWTMRAETLPAEAAHAVERALAASHL